MSFKDAWNVATALQAYPCASPSPIIWAATLAPAIAPALLEWFTFGCRDVMKFRLGRGVPCGRAMKGQVINALPPSFRGLGGTLLKFEAKFSFAGQMFLLADLLTDSDARWMTLAYQMSGCPDANDSASWDIESSGGNTLSPGVAHNVGGVVLNYRGRPGCSWPDGAIVPPGWHLQASFQIETRPLFGGTGKGLTTWLRATEGGGYDFPGIHYTPGYLGHGFKSANSMTTQNPEGHGSRHYQMMAMADDYQQVESVKGNFTASQLPPLDWTINPLGCLKNLNAETVENPAGNNKSRSRPTLADKALGNVLPKPLRGTPKGKPRAKK